MVTTNGTDTESGRAVMRRADGNPIRVLVVDDEPVLAELVSMALRYEGWEIATAGDGPARSPRRGTIRPTWWSWM